MWPAEDLDSCIQRNLKTLSSRTTPNFTITWHFVSRELLRRSLLTIIASSHFHQTFRKSSIDGNSQLFPSKEFRGVPPPVAPGASQADCLPNARSKPDAV